MKVEALPGVDLAAVLPSLFGFPLQGVPTPSLADGLRALARIEAQVAARRAEYLAEVEHRGVARAEGHGSTTSWLIALSGDPAEVCRSRLAVAASLGKMPQVREAFAVGEVSESRVRFLAQAQALAPEQFARDEALLVAQAASVSSKRLPQVVAEWRRNTDPEGAQADAERLHEQRALHISAGWSGMVHLNGDLDPEGGMVVLAAIRSLAEPAAVDPADPRTPVQCRADALVEICSRHEQAADNGSHRRPQVIVTVPWKALQTGSGVIDTETGPISVEASRRLACDASVTRVILGPGSVPIDVGRKHRVIPPALRRALDLRDQHCTHPQCQAPARWCDAHHVEHWVDGGKTELANPTS